MPVIVEPPCCCCCCVYFNSQTKRADLPNEKVANADRKQPSWTGTQYTSTYSCASGYLLHGDRERHCRLLCSSQQCNATYVSWFWSGRKPACLGWLAFFCFSPYFHWLCLFDLHISIFATGLKSMELRQFYGTYTISVVND